MRSPAHTRVVPDTCVFIDLFRDGAVAERIEEMQMSFRLSSVVHSELLRGARNVTERRFVEGWTRGYTPLTPTPVHWIACGTMLARIRADRGYEARKVRDLQNDLLIGLSARAVGLPVLTSNLDDFQVIAEYVRGLDIMPFESESGEDHGDA